MEYIELTITVCDYSYKNIADSLEQVLQKNRIAKLAGAVLSAGTHAMKDWLVRKTVNAKLVKQTINKQLEKEKLCQIMDISIKKKEEKSMEIKVDISGYQYDEIFAFVKEKLKDKKNIYLQELLPLCLEQFDEVVTDKQKTRLLTEILNHLPDSVLSELLETLKKKTGIALKIAGLCCKDVSEEVNK